MVVHGPSKSLAHIHYDKKKTSPPPEGLTTRYWHSGNPDGRSNRSMRRPQQTFSSTGCAIAGLITLRLFRLISSGWHSVQ